MKGDSRAFKPRQHTFCRRFFRRRVFSAPPQCGARTVDGDADVVVNGLADGRMPIDIFIDNMPRHPAAVEREIEVTSSQRLQEGPKSSSVAR